MEETFRCDLCYQEVPLTDRCRDETIFATGWAICACCEPDPRQRLISHKAEHQVSERPTQHHVVPPLEIQRRRYFSQNEEVWTFPHISGSVCQPEKKYRGRIDAYTAS